MRTLALVVVTATLSTLATTILGQQAASDPVVEFIIRTGGAIPPTLVLWLVYRESRNDGKLMTAKVLEAVPALSAVVDATRAHTTAIEKQTAATERLEQRLDTRLPTVEVMRDVEYRLRQMDERDGRS